MVNMVTISLLALSLHVCLMHRELHKQHSVIPPEKLKQAHTHSSRIDVSVVVIITTDKTAPAVMPLISYCS